MVAQKIEHLQSKQKRHSFETNLVKHMRVAFISSNVTTLPLNFDVEVDIVISDVWAVANLGHRVRNHVCVFQGN